MITVGVNSYVTEAELSAYCLEREITLTGTPETLLIKAMDYLETRKWQGVRTEVGQVLSFPRTITMYTVDVRQDNYVDPYIVPDRIKKAQMCAAVLIDGGADLQAPISRETKREKVDVVEVEYKDTSLATTFYTQLNDLISIYLKTTMGVNRV